MLNTAAPISINDRGKTNPKPGLVHHHVNLFSWTVGIIFCEPLLLLELHDLFSFFIPISGLDLEFREWLQFGYVHIEILSFVRHRKRCIHCLQVAPSVEKLGDQISRDSGLFRSQKLFSKLWVQKLQTIGVLPNPVQQVVARPPWHGCFLICAGRGLHNVPKILSLLKLQLLKFRLCQPLLLDFNTASGTSLRCCWSRLRCFWSSLRCLWTFWSTWGFLWIWFLVSSFSPTHFQQLLVAGWVWARGWSPGVEMVAKNTIDNTKIFVGLWPFKLFPRLCSLIQFVARQMRAFMFNGGEVVASPNTHPFGLLEDNQVRIWRLEHGGLSARTFLRQVDVQGHTPPKLLQVLQTILLLGEWGRAIDPLLRAFSLCKKQPTSWQETSNNEFSRSNYCRRSWKWKLLAPAQPWVWPAKERHKHHHK